MTRARLVVAVRRESVCSPGVSGTVLFTVPCFEIRAGEIVGLTGESGCGKSVFSRSLALRDRRIRYIPQEYAQTFSPHVSLERQIMLAAHNGVGAAEVIRACGLAQDGVYRRSSQMVSGGQLQRAAIARALAASAELVIADEISAAQDAIRKRELADLIHRLSREQSVAFLVISHDTRLLETLCDRRYAIENGVISCLSDQGTSLADRAMQRPGV